ncbi:MAG: hypothetical protein WC506_05255 [Candidatus Micrarchaeia archaeon]
MPRLNPPLPGLAFAAMFALLLALSPAIRAADLFYQINGYNVTVDNSNRLFFGIVNPTATVEANRTPHLITFNGRTPDFTSVPDPTNIKNLTLEKLGNGAISYPSNQSVDVLGANLENFVIIDKGLVSVNVSALNPTFNSSVLIEMNLTGIYSQAAAPTIYYAPGTYTTRSSLIQNGQDCVSVGYCTNISWDNSTGILTFNAPHFSGYAIYNNYMQQIAYGFNGTIGINITSTNQVTVYTSAGSNDSALSFVPVTPPAGGSITLLSNESSNTTGGKTGFLVRNDGNVNVSITVASDKDSSSFVGGSSPLFQMFGGVNETGSCPSLNTGVQNLSASAITLCPSLGFTDSTDTIWGYVLVRVQSDAPPQTSTATLTFTSTQV